MSEKKHIDRLFQEGFKDFEATPTDAVWNAIESKLKQKKKNRRVIPIWWRYAGVAALLLLFITVAGLFFNEEQNASEIEVVDTENNQINQIHSNTNNHVNEASETENVITKNTGSKNVLITETDAISPSHAKTSSSKNKGQSKLASNKKQNTNNSAVNSEENQAIAQHSNEKIKSKNQLNASADKTKTAALQPKNTEDGSSSITEENAKIGSNNEALKNTEIANTNDEIHLKNTEKAKNSETAMTIEEALDKNKELIKNENLKNRWSIAPNVAPVYFNTLGEGSPIDPKFNNSSKTGELNMSYGISASYAVNKKLKIRSGINKVNLGYNTNDIVSYQSIGLNTSSINALENVNSRPGKDSNLAVVSSDALVSKEGFSQNLLTANTTLNQAFGYIEVPLEIQYALSSKKFGVNVIGGFSSLFLDNNEIYSRTDNGSSVFLGEANNINKMSYSANFGVGLNYQVSKKIDLNLEPMFKYQFNTFSNTSGNFTPFFIGVYTGFAIKF